MQTSLSSNMTRKKFQLIVIRHKKNKKNLRKCIKDSLRRENSILRQAPAIGMNWHSKAMNEQVMSEQIV